MRRPRSPNLAPSIVSNRDLAREAELCIGWARANMPVLAKLQGARGRATARRQADWQCLHVETKTAVLRVLAIRLIARGEMPNLTAATGHQIQIMDLGFALQAHSVRLETPHGLHRRSLRV